MRLETPTLSDKLTLQKSNFVTSFFPGFEAGHKQLKLPNGIGCWKRRTKTA
jgi:hypothetical protein